MTISLDLKYLLFRLDFNEYYHEKAIKEEEAKKRQRALGRDNDGMDYDNEEEDDGYGDEEDEDDDDDEDDDQDDDDEDDDQGDEEEDNHHQADDSIGYNQSDFYPGPPGGGSISSNYNPNP